MISQKRFDQWVRHWQQGSGYHVLLGLLLTGFACIPLLHELVWGGVLIESILLITFFQALIVAAPNRTYRIIGLALMIPAIAGLAVLGRDALFPLFPDAESHPGVQMVTEVATTAFLFFLVALTVAEVFRQTRITWSQISAATCSYLLLGVAWKGLYEHLHRLGGTDSFRGFDDAGMGDYFYFSFVTMTTLGYGDIVPVSQPARMLVVLQAIIGQLFLVVLVARLVGMVGNRPKPEPTDERGGSASRSEDAGGEG